MTDFIIKKLPYDLTSNAGLALVNISNAWKLALALTANFQ
jgi:hypothetical protein